MTDEEPPTPTRRKLEPIDALPLVLAVVAAVLLLGGVLFAFASAGANHVDGNDRFRLLGQAANPFISFLALAVATALVEGKRRTGRDTYTAAGVASGIATAVSLAVLLLAISGILTDLTGDASALLRLSAVVSRLATIALSGMALWLAAATGPARP
ncbi:MAG TPA: hypothetical protein VM143_09115 [Acidimicrobiales bacterium]|nr:hypothetical protein [Acidimicrobiales bacterium]